MQRTKIILFTFILCITGFSVKAQQYLIDSLNFIIENSASDREKMKACFMLQEKLLVKDFDECLAAAQRGASLAQKINDSSSFGGFQSAIGRAYYFKGNYDSAATYYYKSIGILRKTGDQPKLAAALNDLGKLYRKSRDLDRALQMYDEAFAIYNRLNDEEGMGTILNESGVVFEYKENYDEAISRYKRSLEIRERMSDTIGIAYSLNFIGGAYTQQKKFKEAEDYLFQSLELRKKLKDSFTIALSHSDLGYMYKEQNSLDKALEQYNLSNAIAVDMKFIDLLLGNYRELAVIAEKKGDFALSLVYYKKQTALKDSIYSGEKMKQIEQLNAKYQAEKKEQQLKLQKTELSRKNYLLMGISLASALLVLSGFTFYRKRQLQHKMMLQEEVMKQQDIATKAIINAEENERKRIAADLHDGVGQLMSAAKMNLSAFENEITFKDQSQKISFEKLISLVDESCKEIRSVSHQMMPNALLKSGLASAVKEFIDKIDNRILKINLHAEGLSERLDSNTETVLYRVIQECVNNVIKHSGASNLDISLIKDEDGISVTVEDNGCGFDTTDKQKTEGIGLKNIRSRVEFLKGTVDFDSSPGKGTLVAIHIPASH
ncbi:MAG: sensor histidine kinase [Ferruginibacter sp.]|nr:sensor histidine kinase [Chitinophagaceae bacterium]MBP6286629.1 sensor histidine kinase [Ferruginibacter sp.]